MNELVLANAIQNSKFILDLEEDWDGHEASAPTDETYLKVLTILRDLIESLEVEVPFPIDVNPCPDGSIEIWWEAESFELYISVPAEPDTPDFYIGRTGEVSKMVDGFLTARKDFEAIKGFIEGGW